MAQRKISKKTGKQPASRTKTVSSKKQAKSKKDETKQEIESLKKKLNGKKVSKKKKEETKEQKVEKIRKHVEKVVKKQEERLPEHIERIKRKEEKGPAPNKERFYVTNAKLLNELYIWRDSAPAPKEGEEDKRIITEEFGKMIKMIAERLTNHSNFKNYSREMKQDMVSYAQFKCIQGIHNYNFEYKNAFAYFTTACYNAFVSEISKYYKRKNLDRDYAKFAIAKLEETADVNSSKILSQFLKEYLGEDFNEKEDAVETEKKENA